MTQETLQPELGRQLRVARRVRGFTLAEVSKATGISLSFLSLVESGKNDLTISRLARLCAFYDLTVLDVLPPERRSVGERTLLEFASEGIRLTAFDAGPDAELTTVELEFEPGGQFEEPVVVPAEIVLVVLEGELEVDLDGSEPFLLPAGELLQIAPGRPHRYRNTAPDRARAVGVVGPARRGL